MDQIEKKEQDKTVRKLRETCFLIPLSKKDLLSENKLEFVPLPTMQDDAEEVKFSTKYNKGFMYDGYIPVGFEEDLRKRLDAIGADYDENDIDLAKAIISLIASDAEHPHQYVTLDDGSAVEAKPISSKLLQRISKERYSTVIKWLETASDGHDALLCHKEYSNCSVLARAKGSCFVNASGHSRLYYLGEHLRKRSKRYVRFRRGYHISKGYGIPHDSALCLYVLASYEHLSLPTIEQVKKKAVQLNGKILQTSSGMRKAVYLAIDHHGEHYWADRDAKAKETGKKLRIRFLDDDIASYESVIVNGIVPPHTSAKCPRAFNSITALRSWIRGMILVDGEKTVGLDFKSLHPVLMYRSLKANIPLSEQTFFEKTLAYDPSTNRYGDVHSGVARYLMAHCDDVDLINSHKTTARLAKEASKTADIQAIRNIVKREHLSYFNMPSFKMPALGVDYVYNREMPTFVQKIKNLKQSSYGHYATSNILFSMEVNVMRAIADEFNEHGIYAVYAYDCFYVAESRVDEALEIMTQIAAKDKLQTYADKE